LGKIAIRGVVQMVDEPAPTHETPATVAGSADEHGSRSAMAKGQMSLSRRAILGGGGVLVGAVLGGLGTAVGTDIYGAFRSRGSGEGRSGDQEPAAPLVTVTAVGVSPKCGGYYLLADRAPTQAVAEISRLPAYPRGRPSDRAAVRAWLDDPRQAGREAVYKWLLHIRAMPVSPWVRVVVEGRSDVAVVLDRLRLVIHDRRPAYGTRFGRISCLTSRVFPRTFGLDLREPTQVVATPGSDIRLAPRPSLATPGPFGKPAPGPSVDFPLSVSRTDPEVLDLVVHKVADDCLWTAELDWTVAGQSGHSSISDHGNPFHASAAPFL
jgi:hypothetical protein